MDWNRGPVIGRGSSATVSLATTPSGEVFAVKSSDLSSSSLLQKERCLLSQLDSPYIVNYLGFDITSESRKPTYNLFLEYVKGGTISEMVKNQGGSLKEPLIQFYVFQILQGLNYLHSNGFVHCDIKGQNLLIGKDGVKIADFGCAKFVQDGDDAKETFSGTPIYMAPEVARGEDQGFPADIWALGCTIIEMATGCNPWPEVNDPVSALYKIGYSEDVPELPSWLSAEAKEFLSKCLKRNKEERWTAKQLLQHTFFDGLNGDSKIVNELERNSPTSILDQYIWDSLEEAFSVPTNIVTSVNDSPAGRIRQLTGGCSNLPNWEDDEAWIAVRGIDLEETVQFLQASCDSEQEHENLEDAEPCTFSTVDGDEPASSSSIQNPSFIYSETGVVSLHDSEADLTMPIESVNHVLESSTIDFKREKIIYSSCTVQKLIHRLEFTISSMLLGVPETRLQFQGRLKLKNVRHYFFLNVMNIR